MEGFWFFCCIERNVRWHTFINNGKVAEVIESLQMKIKLTNKIPVQSIHLSWSKLEKKMIADRMPIPRIQDVLNTLRGNAFYVRPGQSISSRVNRREFQPTHILCNTMGLLWVDPKPVWSQCFSLVNTSPLDFVCCFVFHIYFYPLGKASKLNWQFGRLALFRTIATAQNRQFRAVNRRFSFEAVP